MSLTVFTDVCNSEGGVGDEVTDFDGSASTFFELFGDFGPFGWRQDAAVEPLLFGFLLLSRHAGLGGGLMLRMAVRICPNSGPLTATSASWKVILRA